MFKAMEGDQQIGGVCGYMNPFVDGIYIQQEENHNNQVDNQQKQKQIRVDEEYYQDYDWITKTMLNIFCIQKAQQFEYATSHIFDKSFESLFGFVHVLPGAYSAY